MRGTNLFYLCDSIFSHGSFFAFPINLYPYKYASYFSSLFCVLSNPVSWLWLAFKLCWNTKLILVSVYRWGFFFFNFFQQLFANASVSTRGTMILVLSYSQEQNLQMCNRHWVAVSKCSHSLLTRSTRLRSGIHHLGVSHSRACVLLSRALLQVHFTVIVNSLKSDIITVGFLISTFQRWNSSRGSVEMEVKAVF